MKHGRVRSHRQFDAQLKRWLSLLVVVFQTPTNFSGLDPDHGVLPGGISRRSLEYFGSDGAFFDPLGLTVEFAQNHILKKLLATIRALEVAAGKDGVQLMEHAPTVASRGLRRVRDILGTLRRFKD